MTDTNQLPLFRNEEGYDKALEPGEFRDVNMSLPNGYHEDMSNFHEVFVEDPTVVSVIRKMEKRSQEGMKSYGTSIHANKQDMKFWIENLIEELTDAAIYAERLLEDQQSSVMYLVSKYDEYGAEDVIAFKTLERAKEYLRQRHTYEPYPKDKWKGTEEALEKRNIKQKKYSDDSLQKLDSIQDQDLCADRGIDISPYWGGYQIHKVRISDDD